MQVRILRGAVPHFRCQQTPSSTYMLRFLRTYVCPGRCRKLSLLSADRCQPQPVRCTLFRHVRRHAGRHVRFGPVVRAGRFRGFNSLVVPDVGHGLQGGREFAAGGVGVAVHRQRDRRMPGQLLGILRMNAALGQIADERVPIGRYGGLDDSGSGGVRGLSRRC